MPSFPIETHLVRGAAGERAVREQSASSPAKGTRVSFHGSVPTPENEMCFFAFEATASYLAALAAERVGLEPLRVVEASSWREE